MSFIYVDHTINSAGGQDDEDVRFFHLFMSLFFLLIYHMKYQPGLNHRKMMRLLIKYINFAYGSLESSRLKRRVGTMYYSGH